MKRSQSKDSGSLLKKKSPTSPPGGEFCRTRSAVSCLFTTRTGLSPALSPTKTAPSSRPESPSSPSPKRFETRLSSSPSRYSFASAAKAAAERRHRPLATNLSFDSSTDGSSTGGKLAEARNSVLSEIKALQVRRQGSFKRVLNNNNNLEKTPLTGKPSARGRVDSKSRPIGLQRSSRVTDDDPKLEGKKRTRSFFLGLITNFFPRSFRDPSREYMTQPRVPGAQWANEIR